LERFKLEQCLLFRGGQTVSAVIDGGLALSGGIGLTAAFEAGGGLAFAQSGFKSLLGASGFLDHAMPDGMRHARGLAILTDVGWSALLRPALSVGTVGLIAKESQATESLRKILALDHWS